MAQKTAIQIRRDSALNWATINPILTDGEPVFEIDTKLMKIGNGVTPYNDLPTFDTRAENLTETVNPILADFMIIFQNNVMKKVKLSNLVGVLGGSSVTDTTVMYDSEIVYNGIEIVSYGTQSQEVVYV